LGVLGNTPITQSDYVFRSGYKTGGFSFSEVDYYQFSLSQTSQVTFNLTINGSAFGYANLYLFRNSIYYGYANEITPLVKTLDAGTYFLKIDGNGAYDSTTSSYAPASYNLSLSTGTTISPTITLAVAPASVLEDGTPNLIYTFTRTGLTTNALTVNYGITGTATNGTDYATIGTSVTFAANSATATVTVNPTADTTIENNETVALTLATGTGYTIGTTTAVTGTITNDDFPSITLAVAPASVLEDGTPNLIYTFTRTGATTNALTVNYGITGTATNGTDYATIGTSVNFAANSATATVTVNPTADTTIENNETVALTLATGTSYTIGTTTAVTGTITNDDGPTISLGLNYSAISEDSPSNFIYTFTRTGATTNSLTVNYSIAGTALSTDYTGATPGTSKTITFAAGSATATLTIDPTADTTLEPNETIILQLVSGTGYTIVTTAAQTATIINDDNTRNQQGTNGNSVLLGKNYSDYLTGGTGNDILNGAGNGDYLTGAAGNDTLTGGSGSDTFFFANPNLGIDTITDFTPNEDTIFISASGFGSGLIAGNPLTQTQFILGSSATSASQRFIYNSTNGALSFDADGNGLGTSKQIATLSVGLALTSEDIFVG
jgi:Ca2+-binding RTX toxin-like protein